MEISEIILNELSEAAWRLHPSQKIVVVGWVLEELTAVSMKLPPAS